MFGHQSQPTKGRGRGKIEELSPPPVRPGAMEDTKEQKPRQPSRLAARGRARPKGNRRPEQQLYVPKGRRLMEERAAAEATLSESSRHEKQCSRVPAMEVSGRRFVAVERSEAEHSAESTEQTYYDVKQTDKTAKDILKQADNDNKDKLKQSDCGTKEEQTALDCCTKDEEQTDCHSRNEDILKQADCDDKDRVDWHTKEEEQTYCYPRNQDTLKQSECGVQSEDKQKQRDYCAKDVEKFADYDAGDPSVCCEAEESTTLSLDTGYKVDKEDSRTLSMDTVDKTDKEDSRTFSMDTEDKEDPRPFSFDTADTEDPRILSMDTLDKEHSGTLSMDTADKEDFRALSVVNTADEVDKEDSRALSIDTGDKVDEEDSRALSIDTGDKIDEEDSRALSIDTGDKVDEEDSRALSIDTGDKVDKEDSKAFSINTTVNSDTSEKSEEEEDEDSWDKMFDDSGECLDTSKMEELTSFVGEVEITKPKKAINYLDYTPKDTDIDMSAYSHVIEISDFPVAFKTADLLMAFKTYMTRGFDIKWVDDTHALGIFSSTIAANDALKMIHPMMKLKPLSEASKQSRMKAKRCQEFLQPFKPRPETTASAARRLVAGALGLAPRISKEQREDERKKLKEAREKKHKDRKTKEDIWNGTVGECAMDNC